MEKLKAMKKMFEDRKLSEKTLTYTLGKNRDRLGFWSKDIDAGPTDILKICKTIALIFETPE